MEAQEELNDVELWKNGIQQDIADLKSNQQVAKAEREKLREDVSDLKISDRLQNQEINSLKQTLSEIKEDTNWIRRKITGALITAVITAVVGGVIGVAISKIF